MQPHWIEPAPLGDAQRAGMYQVEPVAYSPQLPAPVRSRPQHDPRLIAQQMRQEHARLSGHSHAAPAMGLNKGALGTGLALLGAGAAGYFLGRRQGSPAQSNPDAEELLEEIEEDDDEDEEIEVEAEDEE